MANGSGSREAATEATEATEATTWKRHSLSPPSGDLEAGAALNCEAVGREAVGREAVRP